MDVARVRQVLSRYQPLELPVGQARPAAVLMPLRPDASRELEVVFTRRASDLESHAGQVSFPGGGLERNDSGPDAASLREMREELGVPPEAVEIVGHLDHLHTITGYHIVPVVGVIAAGVTFHPDPREVARVFTVPLARLMDESGWELHEHHWRGSVLESWHFPFDGEDIWGATGRMLRDFVELLWAAGEPGRVHAHASE